MSERNRRIDVELKAEGERGIHENERGLIRWYLQRDRFRPSRASEGRRERQRKNCPKEDIRGLKVDFHYNLPCGHSQREQELSRRICRGTTLGIERNWRKIESRRNCLTRKGSSARRGGRVVDGGGLENHCTRKGTGGSNPSPSANARRALTSRLARRPHRRLRCTMPF
jgi:hypothetical protein